MRTSAILAIALSSGSARAEPAGDLLERGIGYLRAGDDEEAAFALEAAVRSDHISPQQLSITLIYLGVVRAKLIDTAGAREAFRKAIESEPSIQLPPEATEEAESLFEEVKLAVPAKEPVEVPPIQAPAPDAKPTVTYSDPRITNEARGSRWPVWAAVGATVVFAGAAAAFGLGANAQEEDARAAPGVEAARFHHDRAKRHATTANVLFGLAGASAITAGVLYFKW